MDNKTQKVIVVLGMHRSGTSAITRSLELLGVGLGDNLHPAGFDNPKGFWEDLECLEINEELLCHLGSAYDRLDLAWERVKSDPFINTLNEKAKQLVIRKLSENNGLWGFKDPRTCRLLSFWQGVFNFVGCETNYVIVLRNPLSIASSLAKRNRIPFEKSYFLWLQHMLPAVLGSAGSPRSLIDYDLFMDAPIEQIAKISKNLNLPMVDSNSSAVLEYQNSFLDDGLRHSRFLLKDVQSDNRAPFDVVKVYQILLSASRYESLLDSSEINTLCQEQYDRLKAFAPAFSYANTLEDESTKLYEDIAELNGHIARLNQTVADREGQLARLNQTVADRDGQLARLNQTVAESEGKITRLNQAVADRDGEIADLLNVIAERDGQIYNLSVTISDLFTSTSWKVTSPLRLIKKWLQYIQRLPKHAAGLIEYCIRYMYHQLPGSGKVRRRVKGVLFKNLPLIFKGSKAYQAWASLYPSEVKVKPQINSFSGTGGKLCFDNIPAEYVIYREESPPISSVKLLAFYLPQFHPIPENDLWWGKGFTEWTNVTRGTAQFLGHYQPHLPGELGFYDLRLIENQIRQVELARIYGISGFCYHYYWFNGKHLLERPLNQLLDNKKIDFPFCICWANENWSRRWDGYDENILISQDYSYGYELTFIRDLETVLKDKRYIRINNRPLIIVYRAELLPDPIKAAECWRNYCRESGIGEIYLMSTHSFEKRNPRDLGFDAAIEFPPNNTQAPTITHEMQLLNPEYHGIVYDYRFFTDQSRNYVKPQYKLFRGIFPTWDNEARRPGRGSTFYHSSPDNYSEWLDNACKDTIERFDGDERIVFVNAWNEWAEGCHLEPDQRYGYAYLESTRNVLSRYQGDRAKRILYVSHDAGFFGAQLLSLNIVRELHEFFGYDIDVILLEGGALRDEFSKYASVHDFYASGCDRKVQDQILREIFRRGTRAAITSTTVAGKIVDRLKLQGFRIVSLIHELPGIILERNLEEALRNIGVYADKVVFPAIDVSKRINELCTIESQKIIIRPQGLFHRNTFKNKISEARQTFRSEFGMPDDAKIVMGMGYGDYRKGIDLFVETGITMIKKNKGIYFVWFGTFDQEAFSRPKLLIDELNVNQWIIFPGVRFDPDVYFSGADIFLLTSREDPFPSVVLAAMDAGLPVVGFEDSGGFCELLEAGGGLLVPQGDVPKVAIAVDKFLSDNVLWKQTSDKAKKIIGDKFQFRDYVYDLVSYTGDNYFKISVIVPNYNYARYLEKRLLSIIDQSYRPYEIIFLDDCSTDESITTAERILNSSKIPFRIFKNIENQGTFNQWLLGIREAKGDLIWIAEADDYCKNSFLETVLSGFSDPEVTLAYCQSKQIDSNGRVLADNYFEYTRDVCPTRWLKPYIRSGIEEISEALAIKNTIPNVSAVVMKRPDPMKLETLLSGLRIAGDWMTYVEVLSRGKVAYFPDSLNLHRRHKKGVTIGSDNILLLKEIISIQKLISQRFFIDAKVQEKGRAYAQSVYEQLRLNEHGSKEFYNHQEFQHL